MLSAGTLDTIRDWLQIVRLGILVSFVVLGVRVVRTRAAAERRRAIAALVVFVVAVNLGIALIPTDAWPFSPYPMMAMKARPAATHRALSFRAVDARGTEWRVDPSAWAPMYPQSIMGWFAVVYPHATPAERDQVMQYLLVRTEDARRRRTAGERWIGNEELLGPLAATDTNLYGPRPGASSQPYVALRVYEQTWVPLELVRDPNRFTRRLLCEWKR